ncbi:MBL fold metallo-hydrolase [Starkeya sp. ORNL1]|uniref:MBL fold metallo-hydrolase n=1 Tax=Starkeya sp. ORNL1 TaxID=2709380 RepID=UPI0014638B2C|nr:MBL fold metallo-hydrolase [Starkeya sp. ORNL1]QJP15847.1 MBL fold metallo-hydrolase [Starkeya sp. ORNL1]
MCEHNMVQRKTLPRELAEGVFWLGDCLEQRANGKIYHTYNAAFLLVGTEASMLIETGHPKDFPLLDKQMKQILAGRPPLKYLFVTHQETPHSGGLGRVLSRYPEAVLCGDLCDYHLAFPWLEGRLMDMKGGDSIDLGGRSFVAVEPVIRDLRTTWWGFDTKERVLFPGDGFAYSHYHEDGHCGLFAEEAVSLNLPEVSAVFADRALFWTKFTDMNLYADRLQWLVDDLDVRVIAPSHGLPILDPAQTVPKVKEGLLYGSSVPESGTETGLAPPPRELEETARR